MEATDTHKGEQDVVSAIGAGIVITGQVECSTDLQIDGRVNGDVRCPTLLLSEGGLIVGSVVAERVRISGKVEGPIDACDLAIEATGRIRGNAIYTRLKVSPGGIVHGNFEPREQESDSEPGILKLVEAPDPVAQVRRVFGD